MTPEYLAHIKRAIDDHDVVAIMDAAPHLLRAVHDNGLFTAEIAKLQKALCKAEEEIATDDKLLDTQHRLSGLFDCPAHGPRCVPYAINEVARLRSFASEAAEVLSQFGNGRTDDEIHALRELAFSVAPDWSAERVPSRSELVTLCLKLEDICGEEGAHCDIITSEEWALLETMRERAK